MLSWALRKFDWKSRDDRPKKIADEKLCMVVTSIENEIVQANYFF